MEQERAREDHTQRSLATAAVRLINDQTPVLTRERQVEDDPPEGVMDGANTAFTLSDNVVGQEIRVHWGNTAGNTTISLKKSNANPPPADSFFFDTNQPNQIIVGSPPAAADALIATYLTAG